MARRRRGLTPEDRRLWDQVAASATPLKPQDKQPDPSPAASSVIEAPPDPPAAPPGFPPKRPLRLPAKPSVPTIRVDLAPDPHGWLDRATPHMDRRRFERLRRGRLEPEGRLDLHGMTAEVAHQALMRFILNAHAGGLRLVLVITGKGKPNDTAHWLERRGVLKHSVPHWLAMPPLGSHVLQVAAAHDRHGGGGAYYVYLRRTR